MASALLILLPFADLQSSRFTSVLVIGLISNWFLGCTVDQHIGFLKRPHPLLIILWLGFGLHALSCLWTNDWGGAGFILGQQQTLLWFPFVFLTIPLTLADREVLLKAFILGLFLALAWTVRGGIPYLMECPICVIEIQSPIHRPYFGGFLGLGAVAAWWLSAHSTTKNWRYVSLFLIVAAFGIMAKMVWVSMAVTGGLIVLWYQTSTSRFPYLIGLMFGLLVGAIILFVTQGGNSSLAEIWWIKTSIQERNVIWQCVGMALKSDFHWLYGYGLGSWQTPLHDIYCRVSLLACDRDYNAHNQLLDYWLNGGVTSLAAIVILVAGPIRLALRQANPWLLAVAIFMPMN
jgi:hypothetical protein